MQGMEPIDLVDRTPPTAAKTAAATWEGETIILVPLGMTLNEWIAESAKPTHGRLPLAGMQ